ncbi:N-acetylmuramate alpha-1-phosphate uridylyltransferase MurU [Nitrincola schmidtii]|uniref:N-acetylmuramate alpha-1-phosphate uridylyltransferase MurU n=1 Tax=Nitrincola schmidtii TaxID=1730894 RepID=UPI00124EACFB|nr:nucleotidyltransferase family protein [Nitrincola schmidtii]
MKAMILAAGLGTRMRPLTLTTPKPLLPVADKPLIQWHIERLVNAGITDLVINHAWLGEQIEDYLGKGEALGCHIHYSAEGEPLETGGGIFRALPLLIDSPGECFLVVNADVFCDVSFSDLLQPELKCNDLGRLLMVDNPDWHPNGDFLLDESTGYLQTDHGRSLTYSGISLLSGRLFEGCAENYPEGVFGLAPLLRQAITRNQLQAIRHKGFWSDIGTPERLSAVNEKVKAGDIA